MEHNWQYIMQENEAQCKLPRMLTCLKQRSYIKTVSGALHLGIRLSSKLVFKLFKRIKTVFWILPLFSDLMSNADHASLNIISVWTVIKFEKWICNEWRQIRECVHNHLTMLSWTWLLLCITNFCNADLLKDSWNYWMLKKYTW